MLGYMDGTTTDRLRHRLQVHRNLPSPDVRKALREAADLTQQELADAVGVTRRAIGLYEAGRTPQGSRLDRYVEALLLLQEPG
jgi:DNA-binding XRE family transcriptional regulator